MVRSYEVSGLPEYVRPRSLDTPEGQAQLKQRQASENLAREVRCMENCPLLAANRKPIKKFERKHGPFSAEALRNENTERFLACNAGPLVCGDTVECQSEYTETESVEL